MSKFTAEDRIKNERDNWVARNRAMRLAQDRLKREGIEYPKWDGLSNYIEFYDALLEYGKKEAAYMLEFLKMPSGDRPLVEPKKQWTPYDN